MNNPYQKSMTSKNKNVLRQKLKGFCGLCVGTDCEPVGWTIGPLQTVQPGLYPRANFYLEKHTPYVSKQSADYTAGDCTPKRMEKHPHTYTNNLQTAQPELYPQTNFYLQKPPPYVSKQSADSTAWDCTLSELLFGETLPQNNLQTAQPGIVPPSELLSREIHTHTYQQCQQQTMPTAKLSAAAYAEKRSGVLSVRGAKRKYKISQRRYQRIRKGGRDVVAQHEVQNADAEDNFRIFLECFPHSCITFWELHILEEFGHIICGYRSIPRQLLENYMLFAKEFVAQGWIVDIVLVTAPGKTVQAFCRYVLVPEDKLPQFAGKQGQHTRWEDCLEVSQSRQNFLLERIGNCRCGSNSHCTESKNVSYGCREMHMFLGSPYQSWRPHNRFAAI